MNVRFASAPHLTPWDAGILRNTVTAKLTCAARHLDEAREAMSEGDAPATLDASHRAAQRLEGALEALVAFTGSQDLPRLRAAIHAALAQSDTRTAIHGLMERI